MDSLWKLSVLYFGILQHPVIECMAVILPPKKTLKTLPSQAEEDHVEASDQGAVPPPKQLTLERQLNKSILIGDSDDLAAMVMMIRESIVISRIFYKIFFHYYIIFRLESPWLSTRNNRNVSWYVSKDALVYSNWFALNMYTVSSNVSEDAVVFICSQCVQYVVLYRWNFHYIYFPLLACTMYIFSAKLWFMHKI